MSFGPFSTDVPSGLQNRDHPEPGEHREQPGPGQEAAGSGRKMERTSLVDMSNILSVEPEGSMIMTRVGGPGEGESYRILPHQEIRLGRDPRCEIVLNDDPVSRRHARITYQQKWPEIEDLGSTNGTFVNGERIDRIFLEPGDTVQVGNNVFEISFEEEPATGSADLHIPQSQKEHISAALKRPRLTETGGSVLAGRLRELNLASLLQILEGNKSSGTLVVRKEGLEGNVWLQEGRLHSVRFGKLSGAKAFYRMMGLKDGTFELFIPGREPYDEPMEGSLQGHLLEGMRQIDELAVLRPQLPPAHARLVFATDKAVPLHQIPARIFEVMAAISKFQTVGQVIEHCDLPDLDVSRIVLMLIRKDVVKVASTDAKTVIHSVATER